MRSVGHKGISLLTNGQKGAEGRREGMRQSVSAERSGFHARCLFPQKKVAADATSARGVEEV